MLDSAGVAALRGVDAEIADVTRRVEGPVIAWVDAFADRHDEHGTRPALGMIAGRLAARLRGLWQVETHSIPYFPAFTSPGRG